MGRPNLYESTDRHQEFHRRCISPQLPAPGSRLPAPGSQLQAPSYCGVEPLLEPAGLVAVELGFFAVDVRGFFADDLSAGPSSTTVVVVGVRGAAAALAKAIRILLSSVSCACDEFKIDCPSADRALSSVASAPCSELASSYGAARFAVSTTRSKVS